MEAFDWRQVVRPRVAGRRIVLAGGVVAAWTDRVKELRECGAGEMLIVATGSVGTGPLPDGVEWVVVPTPEATTMMEAVRAETSALSALPADVIERVDAFDPDRSAVVFGSFLNATPDLAGRPFVAYRHAEWVALEEKTTVDALWDRAGVAREPSCVVAASVDAVSEAAAHVDRGDGVVIAGDARDGWHGGASLVRWADSEALQRAAVESLAPHCDRVRVMPYLRGVPCSIHGIVVGDDVLALRPCEMVVSRRPDGRFFYAGCATFWDPPSWLRDEARSLARRVGALLRAEVGFRGAFTVDGVATKSGFRPTELNPRAGAGLNVISRAANLPVLLLLDAIVAGWDLGCSAESLERALLDAADAHRGGGTWSIVPGASREPTTLELVGGLDGFAPAAAGQDADATMVLGPAHGGVFVRTTFPPDRTPVGESIGARAVAAWRYADAGFGFGLGSLEAAPDVHAE
jgi:hypothetical protein